ncbi:MAG: hypothetical protein IPL53_25385 [Ignavibacteria bacterium]|nr:hypothetical protein [Ignavibacteria bacterium]
MNNRIKFLLLLIIPVLVFLISISLKNYQGPYFTNYQSDPSYVYLISSLNLSQLSGYGVTHIDHPGTPVQVIGAFVIRIVYFFTGQENSLAQEVLFNPEKYLDAICYTIIFLNCFGLFILGVVAYNVYSNVIISLLLQSVPFTSVKIISLFTFVMTENFLFFVVCIFISALILFVNISNAKIKKYSGYVILIGIISGLGISTKITFIPLIIIPLMLFRGIKYKLSFLLVTVLSFLFFVLPAISSANIDYFIRWISDLLIYSERYGKGAPTIIDQSSYLYNIKRIFIAEWFFGLAYFSVILSLMFCLITNFKNASVKIRIVFTNDNKYKLALGIFIAMTLQILIVAKHYGENYMFPSLAMSVFAVFISVSILKDSFGNTLSKRRTDFIFIAVLLLIYVNGAISVYVYSNYLKVRTEEAGKLLNFVEKNSDNSIVTTSIHTNNRMYPLFFCVSYAGSQRENYKSILNSEYPSANIFFKDKCYSFSSDTGSIEKNFKSVNKILFLCKDENYLNEFLVFLKKQYSIEIITSEKKFLNKNGEMVYEIRTVP